MVDPSEPADPPTAVLAVYAPLARTDVAGLCGRLLGLLREHSVDPFPCDVSALTPPDLAVIEALARLQLSARGVGRRIRLRGAGAELRDLLTLTGLDGILPAGPGRATPGDALHVECRREVEQREEVQDVQERVDADDPPL
ncbi:STAS domain-containing protein [Embleya sp. AB8]|uniref:STAS domain-containing protein n=1 Tax=Embleya sp. AB8 TaxID=3156304 RepID=UPI003C794468